MRGTSPVVHHSHSHPPGLHPLLPRSAVLPDGLWLSPKLGTC